MGVGEHHALRGQAIHVGRGDLAVLRIQALNVAVAQVVRKDIDDVGATGVTRCCRSACCPALFGGRCRCARCR